uniref:Uncharacterized protein n=1 Tax=Arundo donax TaxID=35708 RepID=A0A0A9EDJ0_ARUDO
MLRCDADISCPGLSQKPCINW